MRRFLALLLAVNALFLGILVSRHVPVAQGGTVASANGDTNGDGTRDLSDAVYLLAWLFRDGPAPVPCPGGLGLPDTGQTTCYSLSEVEVECFSFCPLPCPLFGQDGRTRTGCPNDAGRFVVSADDTVTDNCTGLQWQKSTVDFNGDGQPGFFDQVSWLDALEYCENLSLAGHEDWRLPNVRELQSVADYGQFAPAINPVFRDASSRHWSSTSYAANGVFAWHVNFGAGQVDIELKGELNFVRAVRGGL
jgi:hypothetical protein